MYSQDQVKLDALDRSYRKCYRGELSSVMIEVLLTLHLKQFPCIRYTITFAHTIPVKKHS